LYIVNCRDGKIFAAYYTDILVVFFCIPQFSSFKKHLLLNSVSVCHIDISLTACHKYFCLW